MNEQIGRVLDALEAIASRPASEANNGEIRGGLYLLRLFLSGGFSPEQSAELMAVLMDL